MSTAPHGDGLFQDVYRVGYIQGRADAFLEVERELMPDDGEEDVEVSLMWVLGVISSLRVGEAS